MAYVFPSITGKMGSTNFYQATVSAQELASVAITAGELDDWKSWGVFERFQRELDIRRVRRDMVPYLAKTKDRFYSALIVLVYEPDFFEFEPITTRIADLPAAIQGAVASMGILTIDGGNLVVLDGQHRLVSLREIVTRYLDIEGEFVADIADDELSVIFIRHESFEKTRRIFNKVNRYAKPTSISDNVITSEDDGSAIVARWLVEPEPPLGISAPIPPLNRVDRRKEPIVEWRSNKLENDSTKITTLNHLYQSIDLALSANGIRNFDERHRVNRPSDKELLNAYAIAANWWSEILTGMDVLRKSLNRPSTIPERRKFQSEDSLLLRPAGQIILFRGIAGVFTKGMLVSDAVERANKISWRAADEHWLGIALYANGHLKTKESDSKLAGRYVSYLIGSELFSENEIRQLRLDLAEELGIPRYSLPDPVE